MRNLKLIFTRDFDQWGQEMTRNILVDDLPRIWGRGLEDQIVYFNGRTSEWYRYEDDVNALRDYIAHKDLQSEIFSKEKHKEFIAHVVELRKLLAVPYDKISDPVKHLSEMKRLFALMYPYYPLGVFIPGPWREAFLKGHPDGEKVLELLMESRHKSEGLVKETGNYIRAWIEPIVLRHGYTKELSRLLTVSEVEKAITEEKLPTKATLEKRGKGYVYIRGEIKATSDFSKFLKENNLTVSGNDEKVSDVIKGTVAYKAPKISGTVSVIMNSYEADAFPAGNILVTSMTSPDFLPAMKRAIAFITDEGGITCHAAIVARELGKPCIIGTKIATKALKDGDIIEIDAEKGIVKIIKKNG